MIHRLHWHRRPGDGPYSSPSSLAPYLNEEVTIEVLPHQTALLVRNHEIRASLLPGDHLVKVRDPLNRPSGSIALATVRAVHPEDVVIFLHLGSFPVPLSSPLHGMSEGWKGVAHLQVNESRRFYESFLRHSEDLPPDRFEAICGRLMSGIAAKHPRPLDSPAGRDTLFAKIGVKLRNAGLLLERLDLNAPQESKSEDAQPLVTSAGKL